MIQPPTKIPINSPATASTHAPTGSRKEKTVTIVPTAAPSKIASSTPLMCFAVPEMPINRVIIPSPTIRATTPPATINPPENPISARKNCSMFLLLLPFLSFSLFPVAGLDQSRIHIILVGTHLHLQRCRIRAALLLCKVMKENQNAEPHTNGIGNFQ